MHGSRRTGLVGDANTAGGLCWPSAAARSVRLLKPAVRAPFSLGYLPSIGFSWTSGREAIFLPAMTPGENWNHLGPLKETVNDTTHPQQAARWMVANHIDALAGVP